MLSTPWETLECFRTHIFHSLDAFPVFLYPNKVKEMQEVNKQLTSTPWAVRLSWLENAYSCPCFWWAILTRKVIQADLVFSVQ